MGMFEGMLLMRVKTVACVTEQNDFFLENERSENGMPYFRAEPVFGCLSSHSA